MNFAEALVNEIEDSVATGLYSLISIKSDKDCIIILAEDVGDISASKTSDFIRINHDGVKVIIPVNNIKGVELV